MHIIIIALVVVIVVSLLLSKFVRAFPRFSYLVYRFCGTLTLLCLMGVIYKFYSAGDQKTVMIKSLAIPFMIFCFCFEAKLANAIRQSTNESWWMFFLKFLFGFWRIAVPPLGMLASAFQTWFHEERIQDQRTIE